MTTTSPRVDYSYPHDGITNNVSIAAKDFRSVGIVFVTSQEVIDSFGSHTGSKITYEMFMREAARLQADDVINIKIDINRKVEVQSVSGITRSITTYNYTGTGLAIRYTDAILIENSHRAQSLSAIKANQLINPEIASTPTRTRNRSFDLDGKSAFAVSSYGVFGTGNGFGVDITLYESYNRNAFMTPSYFISGGGNFVNYENTMISSTDTELFTFGAGVLFKRQLAERIIVNLGGSLEYFAGNHWYSERFSSNSNSGYWVGNTWISTSSSSGWNSYSVGISSFGMGTQGGISFRVSPGISLDLNGLLKFAFSSSELDGSNNSSSFGNNNDRYSYRPFVAGVGIGLTYMYPY